MMLALLVIFLSAYLIFLVATKSFSSKKCLYLSSAIFPSTCQLAWNFNRQVKIKLQFKKKKIIKKPSSLYETTVYNETIIKTNSKFCFEHSVVADVIAVWPCG